MLKKTLLFTVIVLLLTNLSFAAQISSGSVTGKIIEVNSLHNFVVVNLGADNGIELGLFLQVLRQDKEVGKLEIIRVRPTIAAAEIRELKTGEELKTDDVVALLSGQKKIPETQPQKDIGRETKPKPTSKEKISAAKPVTKPDTTDIKIASSANIVEADIKASTSLVFDAANVLLRDRGFIVTVANREAGILVASKGLILSRWKELWAGLSGSIDHELVFSVRINERSSSSHLEVSISAGYLKRDRYIKLILEANSYAYKEATDLIAEIKDWTEGRPSLAESSQKKTP